MLHLEIQILDMFLLRATVAMHEACLHVEPTDEEAFT